MYYPEETIEEVRVKNDIVDVIGSVVHLKKKGVNYFGLCPFHNEKTPSFSVSPEKQIYYCFGCGSGGNVVSFVMNYENMTFTEAVKSLADRAGVVLPEGRPNVEESRKAKEKQRTLALLKEAASFYFKNLRSPEGRDGMAYLRKRGLSAETMQSFGLGYAGRDNGVCALLKEKGYTDQELNAAGLVYMDEKRGARDRFFNRVIFPIMDINNHVIGFGGRVMGDGQPKYLNSPETEIFNKRKNLYGLNRARKSRKKYMIACEGYMDVIACHEAGFTEAVASLGTAFTVEQAGILKRYTEEVRLIYDSDEAGVRAALRAIPILRNAGIKARVVKLSPCKDPDEFIRRFGAEEFGKRVEEAENSLSFEIHVMEKEYDLNDPGERTAFQQKLSKRLGAIGDEIERNNFTEAFAAEYLIKDDLLKRAVEQARLSGDTIAGAGETVEFGKTERKRDRADKERSGSIGAEKLFLTLLSDDPERIYPEIKPYIEPEDFSPGITGTAAKLLFEKFEKGVFKAGAVLNYFSDPEEQREAAEVFNTPLDESLSGTERENALTDLMIRIKKDSIRRMDEDESPGTDPIGRAIREKQILEKLERMRIRRNG